ncbi:hypothetical protein [Cyanobium sp. NIES-981]|uniref:hypothetical protein n=1 Tax=Cyanobium sp. NIES-981 TaxID=1851505 RepID=UPI0007DDB65E|nr:hypothetical protein [Cyanobium sp. NIES-981]SBO42143.1 conserved protein of unknown function [Cyanobium sp. NIES-981]
MTQPPDGAGPHGSADDQPITPHAAPILDADGQLTYVGDDGRRYVVGLPPEADEESVERVMATLRRGGTLFQQIEHLCHRWIGQVSGADLEPRAALVLLLTTLETALEDHYPESASDP